MRGLIQVVLIVAKYTWDLDDTKFWLNNIALVMDSQQFTVWCLCFRIWFTVSLVNS